MAGTTATGHTGKIAKFWLQVWVLGVYSKLVLSQRSATAAPRPAPAAAAGDPRCSALGFTVTAPETADTSADSFLLEVPSEGLGLQFIYGGKTSVHLLDGSISEAIGFDIYSYASLQSGASPSPTFGDQTYGTGMLVFPDFPKPGTNSTISYAECISNTENVVTGGTNAFLGIVGQVTYLSSSGSLSVSGNSTYTFRYANGFTPDCST